MSAAAPLDPFFRADVVGGLLGPPELNAARAETDVASPRCGFASPVPGNHINWEQQQARLRLVVAAAAKFWP